uniref:Uncharacterized protein n=1 Tax=Anguilla anguilla TaxID=7936 RepID=A0A0E9S8M9_ANGAN
MKVLIMMSFKFKMNGFNFSK